MRAFVSGVGALLGVLLAVYLWSVAASPSDEVAVLVTRDADGGTHETKLWVVEDGGNLWLRSGSPTSAWLARLRSSPDIELERAGQRRSYHAVPVETPEAIARVNEKMAEKYGASETLVGLCSDRSKSIAIRVDHHPVMDSSYHRPGPSRLRRK